MKLWELVPTVVIEDVSAAEWEILRSGSWVQSINNFEHVIELSANAFLEKATDEWVRDHAEKKGLNSDEYASSLKRLISVANQLPIESNPRCVIRAHKA